jgi:hypothetical protein
MRLGCVSVQQQLLRHQMQAFINSVQAADMPDDAKTAQINAAQESFNNTIRYMDAAYSKMPLWSKEWSLLPATIG